MRTRVWFPLVLATAILCTPGCVGTQHRNNSLVGVSKSAWNMLGQRRVRLVADRNVIPVTAFKGRYRRIMIVVHGSALEMYDIEVTFANGDTFSPATRLHFAQHSRSRVIDLPGARRTVRKVAFRYRSKNALTGFAEVELWGKE